MKPFPRPSRTVLALLAGLLIGLISLAVTIGIAQARAGTTTPAAQARTCADCHPNVASAWSSSAHAQAFSDPVFTERWTSLGKPGSCLVCHATGYQATSNTYTAEGVQCEACHGPAVEGHPPAVVPVRADTEYCGTCHTTTIGEWRLTGHAAANVGCSDCHNPHSQAALFTNPNELCLNCHKKDIGDHKKDLHIQKGLGCVDCHRLTLPLDEQPVDGLVPTGHTFVMTASGCVSCHTDTLKIGKPLPGYEAGAAAVAAGLTDTGELTGLIEEYTAADGQSGGLTYEQQIEALQAALINTRLSTLFQGGLIGLVLGGSTVYFLRRNQRREEEGGPQAETPAMALDDGGDVIDRFLINALKAFERALARIAGLFARAKRSRSSGKK